MSIRGRPIIRGVCKMISRAPLWPAASAVSCSTAPVSAARVSRRRWAQFCDWSLISSHPRAPNPPPDTQHPRPAHPATRHSAHARAPRSAAAAPPPPLFSPCGTQSPRLSPSPATASTHQALPAHPRARTGPRVDRPNAPITARCRPLAAAAAAQPAAPPPAAAGRASPPPPLAASSAAAASLPHAPCGRAGCTSLLTALGGRAPSAARRARWRPF